MERTRDYVMKKKLVIIGIAVLLICVGLSGCNEENNHLAGDESKFVGTWRESDYNQLIFYSNGTGLFNNFLTTWEIKDGRIILYLSDVQGNLTSNYAFSNNDNTLTLFDTGSGDPVIYTKQ